MVRRTAILAAAAIALTAAVACSTGGADKGRAGANPTLATDPPATTTTNPYAVPAVIDAAYVNRVLAGLDATLGDVTRLIVKTRTIPREAYERMRAVFNDDDRLQLEIDLFQRDLRNGLDGYRPSPGNSVTTVSQLLTTTDSCVFARVTRDYTAVGLDSLSASTLWVALKPLNISRDPNGYNTTNWAFHYEGFTETRTQPPDPCGR